MFYPASSYSFAHSLPRKLFKQPDRRPRVHSARRFVCPAMSSTEQEQELLSVEQLSLGVGVATPGKQVPAPKQTPTAADEKPVVVPKSSDMPDVPVTTPQVAKELKPLTPEQVQKIVTQVQFYFSDANLPTDAFLLKKVKSNHEGWVDISVVTSFNRMKQLLKKHDPVSTVAEILQKHSTDLLVVDETKTKVRRLTPLPEFDLEDLQARTVVVENLGREPTIGSVVEKFTLTTTVFNHGKADGGETASNATNTIPTSQKIQVKPAMVRLRHPGMKTEAGVVSEKTGLDLVHVASSATHALVEYGTREHAIQAVAQKNDDKDWRNGLRVRLLVKNLHVAKKKKDTKDRHQKENDKAAAAERDAGEGGEAGEGDEGDETEDKSATAESSETSTPSKKEKKTRYKKGKRDYSQWASAAAFKENKTSFLDGGEGGEGDGGNAGENKEKTHEKSDDANLPRQPTMPNGTRGFACAFDKKKRSFPKGVLTTPLAVVVETTTRVHETVVTEATP